jgi:chromosome segregation ATPase
MLERSRKRLLSALVLRARDELSVRDTTNPSDQDPCDPFWLQLETILSRQESRMAILLRKASTFRSRLEQSRQQTSVIHTTRMQEASAELARVRSEVADIEVAADHRQTDAQGEEVQSQIAQTDTQIRDATWLVTRLRKATAELKSRLEALMERASSGALRTRQAEQRMRGAGEEISEAERQIAKLDGEISELEKREAACSLLVASLAPRDVVAAKMVSKRRQK